ncbi:MAG: CvpA family protein [Deltaproteobacteria bacterium]|nr:CvpA family protein [Deltaproteobacteria bacterium]MBW2015650.1 CvpA family protein [Deltaproteobacteria bacterium]MBW2128357.1 CvpA family protein [Deltaproteobacteria bacterium]MBW2302511.1 CvpA family protein [Deltaproteobacteria bacterium]
MNVLDIIIIAVMTFLIVRGLMRGFFKEIASLAGVILGILLALRFQPEASALLQTFLPRTRFLNLIAFAGVFFSVLLVCNLLGWAMKWLFRKALLGWVDKTLGVGLAALKGILIVYLGIVLLTFFLPARTPLLARSRLGPLIVSSYQTLTRLISPEHYRHFKKKFVETALEVGGGIQGKASRITEKQ